MEPQCVYINIRSELLIEGAKTEQIEDKSTFSYSRARNRVLTELYWIMEILVQHYGS